MGDTTAMAGALTAPPMPKQRLYFSVRAVNGGYIAVTRSTNAETPWMEEEHIFTSADALTSFIAGTLAKDAEQA